MEKYKTITDKFIEKNLSFIYQFDPQVKVYIHGSYLVQEYTGIDVSAQDIDILVVSNRKFDDFVEFMSKKSQIQINKKMQSIEFNNMDIAYRRPVDPDYQRMISMVNFYPTLFKNLEKIGLTLDQFAQTFAELRKFAMTNSIYSNLYLKGTSIAMLIYYYRAKDAATVLKKIKDCPTLKVNLNGPPEKFIVSAGQSPSLQFISAYGTNIQSKQKTGNSRRVIADCAIFWLFQHHPIDIIDAPYVEISFPSKDIKYYERIEGYLFDFDGIRAFDKPVVKDSTAYVYVQCDAGKYLRYLDEQKKYLDTEGIINISYRLVPKINQMQKYDYEIINGERTLIINDKFMRNLSQFMERIGQKDNDKFESTDVEYKNRIINTIARELGMKGVKTVTTTLNTVVGGNSALDAPPFKFGPRTTPETGAHLAYTFLLMKGDRYLKGVIVGAQSVRKHSNYCKESKCDIVCMITPDVSDSAYEILKRVCDRVIEIPYIEHRALEMKGEKQRGIYQSWQSAESNVAFTKGWVLGLSDYRKVIFVDADMIHVASCDDLFDLTAPAATFSRREAEPYVTGTNGQKLANGKVKGVRNPYIKYLRHGDKIPYQVVQQAIRDGSFVMIAAMFMVEPNDELFRQYVQMIKSQDVFNAGNRPSMSGADEVSICQLYCNLKMDFTQIHQIYNYIEWSKYGDWLAGTGYTVKDVKVIHYFGVEKVWEMDPQKWPDLRKWWDYADDLRASDEEINKWWRK